MIMHKVFNMQSIFINHHEMVVCMRIYSPLHANVELLIWFSSSRKKKGRVFTTTSQALFGSTSTKNFIREATGLQEFQHIIEKWQEKSHFLDYFGAKIQTHFVFIYQLFMLNWTLIPPNIKNFKNEEIVSDFGGSRVQLRTKNLKKIETIE